MSNSTLRILLLGALASVMVGCSTTPRMPNVFIDPANRITAAEGKQLMSEGDRAVSEAEDQIKRGKKLVKEGRAQRKKGEAIISRGRQALRAAAMGEEAERLSIKAKELRGDALE